VVADRHVDTIREALAGYGDGTAGHIRIGAIEPAASRRLVPALAAFHRSRPRVRVEVEVGGTHTIAAMVAARQLVVGIASAPPADSGLAFEPLFTERMALLLPRTHPLARRRRVRPRDLEGERLLLTDRTCAFRRRIEDALAATGVRPSPGVEIGSIAALARAVECGLGLAILPVAAASPPPPKTVLRAIHGLRLELLVGLVSPPDGAPFGRALLDLVEVIRGPRHARPDTARA